MKAHFALLVAFLFAGCGTALVGGIPEKSEGHAGSSAEPKASLAGEKSGPKESATQSKTAAADEEAGKGKESGEAEKKEEGPDPNAHVNVRCVCARKRVFSVTAEGLGRTEPLPRSLGAITAAVEGHVHRILVDIGQQVKIGQPIVELDTTVARTALAEKIATRESLRAALALLTSQPRPEECRAAELAVEQGKVSVIRARAVVENLKPLLEKKEVSQEHYFDSEQALQQAILQRDSADAQLKLLKAGPRPEAVAEAQSKIAIAQQAVANAEATLDLLTLRAPIAGVVDSLNCHPGQTLTVGTAVGEIVDTDHLFVTVYFPARSARLVHAGLPAHIEASDEEHRDPPSSGSDALAGRVAFVGNIADPQTGNYPARILVENTAGNLRVGQVVKAAVVLETQQATIAVPEAAIFDQGDGPVIAVVREGKIKLLHPEVGASEGGWVCVGKTDLRDNEPVVVEGAYSVPEGIAATILSPAAEPPKETAAADPPKDKPAADPPKENAAARGGEHE
jgi:HlyD family secretion protein